MSFSILGTGSAFGSDIITNKDWEKRLDTSDEWIIERTGIRERHVLKDGESLTVLGSKAAKDALDMAGVDVSELDYIICATVTPDYKTPSQACALQESIGAKCPAYDINAGCSGFIYALDIARGYYAINPDLKGLIVSADAVTRLMDWNDRSTAVLFGDAAAAVVLGAGDSLKSIRLKAKGDTKVLYCHNKENEFVHMEGQKVFQFAVSSIIRDTKWAAKEAEIDINDIDFFLLHQANMRIIDFAIQKMGMSKDKFPTIIDKTGNISAVSIPALMDKIQREGKVKKGDKLMLSAFGAGLTSAAAVIEWAI